MCYSQLQVEENGGKVTLLRLGSSTPQSCSWLFHEAHGKTRTPFLQLCSSWLDSLASKKHEVWHSWAFLPCPPCITLCSLSFIWKVFSSVQALICFKFPILFITYFQSTFWNSQASSSLSRLPEIGQEVQKLPWEEKYDERWTVWPHKLCFLKK